MGGSEIAGCVQAYGVCGWVKPCLLTTALLDLQPLHRHGPRVKITRRAQCSCEKGTRTVSWNVGSKGSSGLAQACLCHRLLIQQLPPRNCHSGLSRPLHPLARVVFGRKPSERVVALR